MSFFGVVRIWYCLEKFKRLYPYGQILYIYHTGFNTFYTEPFVLSLICTLK